MNKCPFGMEKHEDCTFYRRGVRIEDVTGKQTPFEECAVNIIADCLENLVQRQVGLQKEMNLVRNEVQATNNIFNEILTRQQKYIDSQGG